MFGFGDFWVAAAYILCILSTVLCVVYGLKHWNDDEDIPAAVHPPDENLDFEETI
ncbi:MAG: hypothetical protein JXR79_05350 [Nitrospirae bacterium]|nr:hypothetical protein [Nitrospirota bacterium]